MKYFFGSPTLGFVCGDAEALVFDHFVASFCSFLLCELSSKNPSNMFLNFGKKCLFFFLGYQHLTLCLTVPKLLFLALFFFWCWVLFNLPLSRPSMISASFMVSLSPASFVVGD